jgi:hypothetical protein
MKTGKWEDSSPSRADLVGLAGCSGPTVIIPTTPPTAQPSTVHTCWFIGESSEAARRIQWIVTMKAG